MNHATLFALAFLNLPAQPLQLPPPAVTLTVANCTEAPLLSTPIGVIDLAFTAQTPPQWECSGSLTITPSSSFSIVSLSTGGSAFGLGPKQDLPKATAPHGPAASLHIKLQANDTPFFDATYVIDSDGPFLFAEGMLVTPTASPITLTFQVKIKRSAKTAFKLNNIALGYALSP